MSILLRILFFAGLCAIAARGPAQYYNIRTWDSFEDGIIPSALSLGYKADKESVGVFRYGIAGTPPEMMTERASFECGSHGLALLPDAKHRALSVFCPVSLDRSRLGNSGSAMYQADFFLPAEGIPMPNIALLAGVADSADSESYKIYRFGILNGGERIYFSYLVDAKTAPLVYKQQMISELNLKRPGWHRFQIIFKGQEEIYCCVDRVPTKFSPIRERSLQNLSAGVMLVAREDLTPVVVDNISIQWSPEEVPLPDSPWVPRQIQKNTNLLAEGSPLPWFDNPSQAWRVATAQRRPMVVLFYSPKAMPYNYLLSICPNDKATSDMLQHFVLAQVDANQLWGAALAEKFQIVRIPTLIVLGPDGKEVSRLPIIQGKTQWSEISAALTGAAGMTSLTAPPK